MIWSHLKQHTGGLFRDKTKEMRLCERGIFYSVCQDFSVPAQILSVFMDPVFSCVCVWVTNGDRSFLNEPGSDRAAGRWETGRRVSPASVHHHCVFPLGRLRLLFWEHDGEDSHRDEPQQKLNKSHQNLLSSFFNCSNTQHQLWFGWNKLNLQNQERSSDNSVYRLQRVSGVKNSNERLAETLPLNKFKCVHW